MCDCETSTDGSAKTQCKPSEKKPWHPNGDLCEKCKCIYEDGQSRKECVKTTCSKCKAVSKNRIQVFDFTTHRQKWHFDKCITQNVIPLIYFGKFRIKTVLDWLERLVQDESYLKNYFTFKVTIVLIDKSLMLLWIFAHSPLIWDNDD